MRIYYVMEARGRRCHVLSALGVDAQAWNRLHRRVREWRRRPGASATESLADGELLRHLAWQIAAAPSELHCSCDCHAQTGSSPQMD